MSFGKKTYSAPVPMRRIPQVLRIRGRSRSSHYQDINNGLYPRPVKIGPRASAHPDDEVAVMNSACIAGKSEEELRELVRKLEAARKAAE